MINKQKILIIHRNSLIQERISSYLRENDFSVIMANNVESTYSLSRSMKPDIILWGESLTARSKDIIRKIKSSSFGSTIPVIAMIPDVELFDRIEIEKNGINDIVDTLPNFTDLKLKIRSHLYNRKKLKQYNEEIYRLQNISELQYNMIRVQDINRLCELIDDHVFNIYRPDVLLTLIPDEQNKEYDYKSFVTNDPKLSEVESSVFEMPLWSKYFFSNSNLDTERISDNYVLKFFDTIGFESDIYYQFPLRAATRQVGLMVLGLSGTEGLSKAQFQELEILISSLAFRVINLRALFSGKQKIREDTAEIQYLFQRLDEDEIFTYLSQQLLNSLKGDVCIYFNYNEGFKFLYPQNCFKTGSDKNLFEHEKPPVLLLKDYPTFEKYIDSDRLSAHYNLGSVPSSDLAKLASIAEGKYLSMLIFSVKVGTEKKGFFIVATENNLRRFTNAEIQSAEQMIQKATKVLMESRVVRQAQKTIKQLDRVFELGKELTLEVEIDDLLKKIATAIRRTLGWNIVILDRKSFFSNQFENVCAFGIKSADYQSLQGKYPQSMYAVLKNQCLRISNSYFFDHQKSNEVVDDYDRRSFLLSIGKEWNDNDWIFVPVQSRGRELGYIAVNDPVERVRPSEEKVRSLEYFANQAAVALENAGLYENLKASENKYRLLAETMIMGLVTCDPRGRIIYVNISLAKMLKYKNSDSLLDHNIFDLCSAKSRGEFEKNAVAMLKNNNRDSSSGYSADNEGVEIELMANDNQYIPFKIYLTPYYQHNKKSGFLGVLSDLRPQKRLERLKADFNSMIVHDLRSPLNIIQGYVDIVRNQVVGKISGEQSELLFIAKDNVDKVLKLIDNFMTASRMEAGKFDLQMEIHSINTIVEAVFEHHLVLAQNKGIKMDIDLDANISFQQLDKLRIEQVVTNYLSNAIKFTGADGKILVKTKLVREKNEISGETNMAARVSVTDSGVGIPKDEQDKVFSKYEQTEAGKDASLKGTGLGLAICKEIISLHKGKVWLESEPGKGSTFYFDLPITPVKI